jgi:hypothetical protein
MKTQCELFSVLSLAFAIGLSGCDSGNSVNSGAQLPTVAVSPAPASIPAAGNVTFSATVSGDGTASVPSWSLGSEGSNTPNLGTLSSTSGSSITYTAPPSPPVYINSPPSLQGEVSLDASSRGAFGSGSKTLIFSITAPQVTTGITPVMAPVALGATQSFFGYAVGNLNNGVSFQVNGVTGGSTTYGTITNTGQYPGQYQAPSVMPMSGNTVTITVLSLADPTKTSSATITLH